MSDIEDRLAIGDIIIRYADSIDQQDYDRYCTCFTDDVEVSGFGPEPIKGLAAYRPWVTAARDKYGRTQHMIGNIQVQVNGDTATMRSYVQATHELPADPNNLIILWAAYNDKLVRTNNGWKITHHELERLVNVKKVHITSL
jgi:ketosteroid isomerase-like protein